MTLYCVKPRHCYQSTAVSISSATDATWRMDCWYLCSAVPWLNKNMYRPDTPHDIRNSVCFIKSARRKSPGLTPIVIDVAYWIVSVTYQQCCECFWQRKSPPETNNGNFCVQIHAPSFVPLNFRILAILSTILICVISGGTKVSEFSTGKRCWWSTTTITNDHQRSLVDRRDEITAVSTTLYRTIGIVRHDP